ncbi:hypothetical protein [Actinomyces sp. ZJ308]|uniref:hypothetical protein n=1 Tax=Actinomyces sp. ZJ308 TaxID=2708342 RepID=UPI001AB0245D|nr:hypothetical protein [Actinomyces sp. ZJ308]
MPPTPDVSADDHTSDSTPDSADVMSAASEQSPNSSECSTDDATSASETALARRRHPRMPMERRRVWSRRLEGFFWALRAGSLLAVVVAVGLYLAWRTDLTMRWVFLKLGLTPLVPAVVLWGIGILAWGGTC